MPVECESVKEAMQTPMAGHCRSEECADICNDEQQECLRDEPLHAETCAIGCASQRCAQTDVDQ